MAVTATFLGQLINSGTASGTYTSSSFTPTAGALILVVVKAPSCRWAGANLTSSVGGDAYVEVAQQDYGTGSRQWVFISDQPVTAVSQTFTFDGSGDSPSACAAVAYEINGSDYSGLAAVLQSAKSSGSTGATPDVTFTSACQTSNLTIAYCGQQANASIGVPTGWTEDFDTGSANGRQECAHRDSGFTGSTITWTTTTGGAYSAFGIEFDGSTSGGGGSTPANTATATYTALAIGHTKNKAIGTAVATYTALSIAAGSALAIGTATETDTALPIGKSKSKAIGTASVSYTALTVGFGNRTAVGTATATYSAGSIGHTKAKAIGIAQSQHFALRIALPLPPALNVKTDQVVINYTPKPLPQINKQFDPVTKYLLDEMKRMQSTINQLAQATPVVANREPPSPRRGMVRYAIAPWDPLGTSTEGYVVYDGTAWVAL